MVNAADKIHCALEPMYSTIDPSLPTFQNTKVVDKVESAEQQYTLDASGKYVAVKSQKQLTE
jgi:hypothetical protein